jgi:hypothetical protein
MNCFIWGKAVVPVSSRASFDQVGGASFAQAEIDFKAASHVASVSSENLLTVASRNLDRRERLVSGAVSLSAYDQVVWAPPSKRPTQPAHRTFANWLNSSDPIPQGADRTRQFMSMTKMNCYEWVILAGLRSGAMDRETAKEYYRQIVERNPNDDAAELKALYGDNSVQRIDVAYTQVNGEWRVGRIVGEDRARAGDILTFNGTDHVMIVTGRDAEGRLLVASFPTVIYGSTTDVPNRADPYAGTLQGFLQENLDLWNINGDGNNFIGEKIRVGAPGFIRS